jgi:D-alanine-D-alanine ligase
VRIGLTYDLRAEYLAQGYGEEETAEFDQQGTIDALADAIESLGHSVDRIGSARALVNRLAKGDRWELVFNIAEGLSGYGREAQVPAILDVYGIAYTFADPLAASVCLHKGWSKMIVRTAGVPTADFAIIETPADVERVCAGAMNFPLLAKPIAEGTGKGVTPKSVVRSKGDLESIANELLVRYHQPVLVETFLPGREFTVGIVGTGAAARAVGSIEIVLRSNAEPEVYSYVNKEECEALVEYRHVTRADPLVAQAEQIALDAWIALSCRDGGRVDIRCDEHGAPMFLEVNPLAGLHPTHSDLPMIATAVGMPYAELVRAIIESAAARIPGASRKAGQSAFSPTVTSKRYSDPLSEKAL